MAPRNKELVALPHKPFLYTIDQVATLVGLAPASFAKRYVFCEGSDLGANHPRLLRARNIDPDWAVLQEWRINEDELKRWLRFIGLGWKDPD